MRVEQIMSRIALAGLRQPHHVDQHVREGVTGHRAVGVALGPEVEEQPAVPAQDRDVTQLALGFPFAQRRYFFSPGRSSCLFNNDISRTPIGLR
jgi:hypothetical protein